MQEKNKAMKTGKIVGIGLLGLLAASAALAAEPAFRPGQWEIIRQVDAGSRKMGPDRELHCITDAQLRDDPAILFNLKPQPREGERPPPECKTTSLSLNGGNATMVASCKVPVGSAKANWVGTYSPTSFNLSGKMKIFLMSAKMNTTGRLLGPCPKS